MDIAVDCRLNPAINKENMIQKGSRWIPKKKTHQNTIEWPCPSPFAEGDHAKPVAHVHIHDNNMSQIKEVKNEERNHG